MSLLTRLSALTSAVGADIKRLTQRNPVGYVKLSTSANIDPSVTKYVAANVTLLSSATFTLLSNKAVVGSEVWVRRFDANSTGNITVAASSGNVQNPSTNAIAGILSLLLPSTYRQVGWVFDGTDWQVISAS